jgi:hypothetical protein
LPTEPTPPGIEDGRWNLAVGFLAVYLLLLMLIPAQLVVRPLGAPGSPANLWAIGGLVWWVCLSAGRLDRPGVTTPIRIAAGLFGATVLASYANGMASGWYAPPGVRQWFDDVWTLIPQNVEQVNATMVSAADRGLLSAAGWLGVVLIAAEGLRSWRDLDVLVGWLAWLGSVVAGLGIVQYFTGLNVVEYISIPGLSLNTDLGGVDGRSVLNRVSSTAVHPIEFGVVMACLFPLALHRAIHRWGRRGALLPMLLIFVGAFLSVSRSAMLDLAVIAIVLVSGWPARWRLRALCVAPLAIVAMRVAFPGLVGTLVALFTNLGNDPSIEGRTDDYDVVLDLSGDHPWLGRGLYTFVPKTYRILDNQWLGILLELGIVGTAVVIGLIVTAFCCARSARRNAGTGRNRHLGLVLSSAIAGAAVSMITYDAWAYRIQSGLTFLVIGLAGAAWRLARCDAAMLAAAEPPTPIRIDLPDGGDEALRQEPICPSVGPS